MSKTPLPILNCDDCGRCCESQGTPPGYALYFPPPGVPLPEEYKSGEDYQLLMAAPPEVVADLGAYYAAMRSGEVEPRDAASLPCLWYDLASKRCRHWEHRPTTCREFEPGNPWCRNYRGEPGALDGVEGDS